MSALYLYQVKSGKVKLTRRNPKNWKNQPVKSFFLKTAWNKWKVNKTPKKCISFFVYSSWCLFSFLHSFACSPFIFQKGWIFYCLRFFYLLFSNIYMQVIQIDDYESVDLAVSRMNGSTQNRAYGCVCVSVCVFAICVNFYRCVNTKLLWNAMKKPQIV